jgi:glycosyltransferase involved in cell wall biosynthesis
MDYRIDVIRGAVPYDVTPTYFQKLEVLVVPTITTKSIREQFGRVIVEAMACNVPVIGSSCGAIPEVIGNAGIVVPENDSVLLAVQLERIINDEELRNSLAILAEREWKNIIHGNVLLKKFTRFTDRF